MGAYQLFGGGWLKCTGDSLEAVSVARATSGIYSRAISGSSDTELICFNFKAYKIIMFHPGPLFAGVDECARQTGISPS
jgi:hypothetical protein